MRIRGLLQPTNPVAPVTRAVGGIAVPKGLRQVENSGEKGTHLRPVGGG